MRGFKLYGDVSAMKFELTVYRNSTTLCLLHRAHMPPAMSTAENATPMDDSPEASAYGKNNSRAIAFRAAHGITTIVDNLVQHDELKYCPAFM
jgi:hypothetical protein